MPIKSKLQVNEETMIRLASKNFCKHSIESRMKQSERMKKVWEQRKNKRRFVEDDQLAEWSLKGKGGLK